MVRLSVAISQGFKWCSCTAELFIHKWFNISNPLRSGHDLLYIHSLPLIIERRLDGNINCTSATILVMKLLTSREDCTLDILLECIWNIGLKTDMCTYILTNIWINIFTYIFDHIKKTLYAHQTNRNIFVYIGHYTCNITARPVRHINVITCGHFY